jgi:hypothetical protein
MGCRKFRERADECRVQADRSLSTLDQEAWLRLAMDWLELASDAEKKA